MSQDVTSLLSKVDLFSDLNHEELAHVAGVVQLRSLAKDETIFSAGDPADAVYIIATGKVKIVVTSTDGRDFILTILGAGQVFGEMALLESAPRSAAVITASQVDVLTIRRKDFHQMLTSTPSISKKLLAILSRRLRRANSKMESLAYMDVAGRLARYLLDLARDHGQKLGNGWIVVRRPTHTDIAHSIGTSRETVSRMINEFEESFGLVNKGKFTYISEHLLD
ncbi:MAG: Crp/Fnr family transcriptional regulator [Acidobacteria bacterium]|nr:MAG: Crp/Fnr family transcriptional regulator [Acidobacteriota bacterium]